MDRKTEMVRTYTSQHDFQVDEQKLSREGWSVEPTVSQDQRRGLLERIRARMRGVSTPVSLVVTYSRQRPS